MENTGWISISPLALLAHLSSIETDDYFGDLFKVLGIFLAVCISPVMIVATAVTLPISIVAGIVQTLALPFQLLYSAFTGKKDEKSTDIEMSDLSNISRPSGENGERPDPKNGDYFPSPLTSSKSTKSDENVEPLTQTASIN